VDINGRINRLCRDIDGRIWTTQVSKPLGQVTIEAQGYYEVDTDLKELMPKDFERLDDG